MNNKKISVHLWFNKEAKDAAKLYTSIFNNSRIISGGNLEGTPSGQVEMVTIELNGLEFTLISAGPLFTFNPSVSFLVACSTKEEVSNIWEKLSSGGKILMEIGEYPFSDRYGWLQDKYGLSWQIMLTENKNIHQKITPTLMFVGDVCGKAEEAINYYVSVFQNSHIGTILRYGKFDSPEIAGTIKHIDFILEGQKFSAMDSAYNHDFGFNEAISFMVKCKNQEEIDYYWEKLSAVPEAEQCGWLKDKFGFSWQIVPKEMDEMLRDGDKSKIARVTEAFLKMKKFDIEALNKAYEGK